MPATFRIRSSDPRATAFRALEEIIRGFPDIAALGCCFNTYDGSPNPLSGADTDRPYIELEPEWPDPKPLFLDPSRPGGVIYEAPIIVHVLTRCPGTLADNSIALWGLIEAAIFRPDDPNEYAEVQAILQAAGCNLVETVCPAAVAQDNVTAEGTFRLTTYTVG